jgi:AcrR family transcriptional regulator
MHDGWVISPPNGMGQALAWSVAVLSSQQGVASVSFRSLARHARMAPGTITNHFGTKREVLSESTRWVAIWLADATRAHVDARGPVGLFPAPADLAYRALTSTWLQLEAYALTEPELDARVRSMTDLLIEGLSIAFPGQPGEPQVAEATGQVRVTTAWLCLRELRRELVRPVTTLTPGEALRHLTAVDASVAQIRNHL